MTAEQLKNSILQEAISGRLVPQDPNDEPAAVLLQRIRAEKARLVKEKKLKAKDIVVTPITVDDIPYEIPNSWEWVRVKELFNVCSARRVHEKDWRSSGIPFYRAREIGKLAEFGHVDNDLYIDQELYNEFSKSGVPQENDLMVTAVGTLGRVYVVKTNEIFYYKDGSVLCMENRFGINAKFAKLVIESPVFVSQYIGESQGTTVATLTMVRMNEYLIPLPPLAEQKRIVAKLEELLPIVEQYGKAQKELDELNAALPARLRNSILQEAISGRLVPQDPNDEPASALLARIREEKARLVKEGTIKAKEVLEYTIDDIPYELPDNWSWVKLGEISYPIKRGKSPVYVENSQYIAFAQKCNTKKGYIDLGLAKYIESKKAETQADIYLKLGDIVINSTGTGTLGRVGLFNVEYPENIIGVVPDSHVATVRLLSIYPEYAYYFLRTCQAYLESLGEGGTNQKELKPSSIAELLFPLPPLAEQQRIVAKIEELFEQIDQIKK